MLTAALEYAGRGWLVVPLNGKLPLTSHGYKDGSTDPEQIRRWWREHPDASVGVVVGPESGLCVLDTDPRAGSTRSLAELTEKYGPLPETPQVATAGGGSHYYFKYCEAARRVTVAPGLEIKARGGYVVAPPSRNGNGGEYTWVKRSDLPLADLPSWLICEATERDVSPTPKAPNPIPEGQRNSTLTSLAGALRRRGASEEAITACLLAENEERCTPPLPVGEIEKIVRSVSRYPAGQASQVGASWPVPPSEAAYHGLAGEFVRLVAPHTEADPVALLSQFLVGVGNLIGRGPFFRVEADKHFTNEFVALVGESSKARKGTAAGHVARVLHPIDPAWADRQQSGLSSGEGLIWAVRDRIMGRSAIRQKGHITGYEEVEEDPGIEDKRLLVFESEFASTLRVMGREGSTLSAVIRQAWDKGNLRIMTKNSPAVATDALISLVTHITRDELRRDLDRTEAGNGFANRFMWFCVRRSKALPRGGSLSESDLDRLANSISIAVRRARDRRELTFSEEAWLLWDRVYGELSEGKPGLLGAVISRAEAHVVRLALIYALLDGSSAIERVHLEAALSVWRYSEDSARYIFGEALGDPVADALLSVLIAQPRGLTDTEISGVFGRNRPAADIARAKNQLQTRGLIYFEVEETGGRAAHRWFASDATKQTKETNEAAMAESSLTSSCPDQVATSNTDSCPSGPLPAEPSQERRATAPALLSSISFNSSSEVAHVNGRAATSRRRSSTRTVSLQSADLPAPAEPTKPCHTCKGRHFWRHASGGPHVCSSCHPVPSPACEVLELHLGQKVSPRLAGRLQPLEVEPCD